MFAVIQTGGKQVKVAQNQVIQIEKLESQTGESVAFDKVMLVSQGASVQVGAPYIAKAQVLGTVINQIRDDKVIIFKKNRRHNYRRKNGHRQYLTVVRITDILPEGGTSQGTKAAAKGSAVSKEAAPKAKTVAKKTTVKKES